MARSPGEHLSHQVSEYLRGMIAPRLLGIRVSGPHVESAPVGLVTLGLGVLVLAWHLALIVGGPRPLLELGNSLGWNLYYLSILVAMRLIVARLCRQLLAMGATLDFAVGKRGRAYFARWVARHRKPVPQILAGLLVAGIAVSGVWVTGQVVGPGSTALTVLPPSYVGIALTGFFVGAFAYWMIFVPLLLSDFVKGRMLRLYPLEPARTPGLESFMRLAIETFLWGAVFVLVVLLPVFVTTGSVGPFELDVALGPGFIITRTVLIAVCGLGLIAIGLTPHVVVSREVRRLRARTIDRMLRRVRALPSGWSGLAPTDLYDRIAIVAASPASTLGRGNIIQLAAAVVGALVPIAVSLFDVNQTS